MKRVVDGKGKKTTVQSTFGDSPSMAPDLTREMQRSMEATKVYQKHAPLAAKQEIQVKEKEIRLNMMSSSLIMSMTICLIGIFEHGDTHPCMMI